MSLRPFRGLLATLTVVSLACAGTTGPSAGGPTPAGDPEVRSARDREAATTLRSAREQFEADNYVVAESLAENVIGAYADTEWLGPALLVAAEASLALNHTAEAQRRLSRYLTLYRASNPRRAAGLIAVARIRYIAGAPTEAADSLLAAPTPLGDDRERAAALARQVVSRLGLRELESVIERWPSDHPLQSVFRVELASLLLVAGRDAEAAAAARAVLESDPQEPERARAERILSGEVQYARSRPVIGAILPLSGPLSPYGRLAEEGIRLGVEEYNRRHVDSVTLVVKDDHDNFRRDSELVRELERLGAVAVVGPLRTEGLELAAESRRDDDLIVVSPTAPENLRYRRNAYSMWSTTERASRGARALAAFAVRDLQLYRFGVLYPANAEGRAQLAAFADEVRAWGAEITGSISYAPDATTFQEPLEFLSQGKPQAIFAPGAEARSVIQLAPQFSFYGLRGVQVLGDADWSSPEALRLVEPRFINGTVISTFLHRSSPSVRWPEFVELYERRYRKGLGDNLVPALAYDATTLILTALPWGYPRRSAVARSFRDTRALPGATGILSVRDGAIMRRPFILEIRDRELVEATSEREEGPLRTGEARR